MKKFLFYLAVILIILSLIKECAEGQEPAPTITASWYSVESCRKEGTSGRMANGEIFNDTEYICASWDYDFGTKLNIQNTKNSRWVQVTVADRGPNKKLYKRGRIIDFSKSAFAEIASLWKGVIPIKIEVVNE